MWGFFLFHMKPIFQLLEISYKSIHFSIKLENWWQIDVYGYGYLCPGLLPKRDHTMSGKWRLQCHFLCSHVMFSWFIQRKRRQEQPLGGWVCVWLRCPTTTLPRLAAAILRDENRKVAGRKRLAAYCRLSWLSKRLAVDFLSVRYKLINA